jgi:hypothetical protein
MVTRYGFPKTVSGIHLLITLGILLLVFSTINKDYREANETNYNKVLGSQKTVAKKVANDPTPWYVNCIRTILNNLVISCVITLSLMPLFMELLKGIVVDPPNYELIRIAKKYVPKHFIIKKDPTTGSPMVTGVITSNLAQTYKYCLKHSKP